jgi:hypothetical protein
MNFKFLGHILNRSQNSKVLKVIKFRKNEQANWKWITKAQTFSIQFPSFFLRIIIRIMLHSCFKFLLFDESTANFQQLKKSKLDQPVTLKL